MKQILGRPKVGSEKLTEKKILEAGLNFIDSYGVEQFTMRQLARALAVDPMAIYYYFENKQKLFASLAELICKEFILDKNLKTWQKQLKTFAHAYYNLSKKHRHFILYAINDIQTAVVAAAPINEQLYSILHKAGLTPLQVISVADLLIDYLHGLALAENYSFSDEDITSRFALFSKYNKNFTNFPTLYSTLKKVKESKNEASLDMQLAIIIAGIEKLVKLKYSMRFKDNNYTHQ